MKHFRFYGQEVKEIIYLGLPAAVQTSLFSISNVLFSSTFNKFGDIAVSGNTVAHQYDDILANTLSGFNAGVLTFISQNLGAKKHKRVWKTLWFSLLFITTFGFMLGSLAYLFSPTLCGFMSDNTEVIACAIRRMRIMSTTQFIGGAMTLFSNLLKAIKKPILSMIGSIFFTLILRLIWLYTIFPLNPTLETYYIVYPITWFICAVVFAIVGIIMLRKIQLKEERLEA
jgi:Na+-driven multidrug efflux pump